MDGWHRQTDDSPTKRPAHNRSLLNLSRETKKKQESTSFAIYAARDGYITAVNSSLNHTRDFARA